MSHKIRGLGRAAVVLALLAPLWAGPLASPAVGSSGKKAPSVVGPMTPEAILGVTPEWEEIYDLYKPDVDSLATLDSFLHAAKGGIQAEVILGTWCGDSRRQVPRYLKVVDLLGPTLLPTRFTGVDRSKKVTEQRFRVRSVERVPTFVLYRDGEEVGRIVETPEGTMEEHLARILAGEAAK